MGYGVARLPVTVATGSLFLVPPIAVLIGGAIALAGVAFAIHRPSTATVPETGITNVEPAQALPARVSSAQ
jgi:hypothetical protein